ncbi:hypothetical protein [Rouxiella badensis]|uniref:gp53-like domain-containing protein n=1 Tax=Rouxiella badensis TaxID=1646377 RepID=UPI002AD3C40E|nr:hypothetical protein [Rouxiella badensis]
MANNFKSFATSSGANVTAQSDWEALAALATGFTSGKASSAQINKALRQSSFIASGVAQFIANTLGIDVLDDGDQTGFVTDLISALRTDTTKNLLPIFINQTNGYIAIPALLVGAKTTFYLQFGTFTGTTDSAGNNGVYENSNINVVWPVAFPNANLAVITGGSSDVSGVGMQEMAWSLSKNTTGGIFGVQCRAPSSSMTGSYIAIGY